MVWRNMLVVLAMLVSVTMDSPTIICPRTPVPADTNQAFVRVWKDLAKHNKHKMHHRDHGCCILSQSHISLPKRSCWSDFRISTSPPTFSLSGEILRTSTVPLFSCFVLFSFVGRDSHLIADCASLRAMVARRYGDSQLDGRTIAIDHRAVVSLPEA